MAANRVGGDRAHGTFFAILGSIVFIPGLHHTRIAHYAYKGYNMKMEVITETIWASHGKGLHAQEASQGEGISKATHRCVEMFLQCLMRI
ncbi:hypothetical protein U1Q18_036720 [Sarracenia purpurea var. burkii]